MTLNASAQAKGFGGLEDRKDAEAQRLTTAHCVETKHPCPDQSDEKSKPRQINWQLTLGMVFFG